MCGLSFIYFYGFFRKMGGFVRSFVRSEEKSSADSFFLVEEKGMDKELAISNSMNITARAVIKTTIIVIVSLLPLLLSEFKSVSQLSIITIISAVIAIVFDLLYLPKLIKKFL